MRTYTVYFYDKQPATHVLCERSLPADVIIKSQGYIFAPPSFTNDLGPPDDQVEFGPMTFPAWRMDGKMPNGN